MTELEKQEARLKAALAAIDADCEKLAKINRELRELVTTVIVAAKNAPDQRIPDAVMK